jgi:eukaryotic-like serine/threonine-protein kinase
MRSGTPADATQPMLWRDGARPTEGLAISLDRREAIGRREHTDAVRRLTVICGVALLVWPAFVITDVLTALWIEPGPLWPFLVLRAVGWVLLAAGYGWLRAAGTVSQRAFRVLDVGLFSAMSLLVALLATLSGGIESAIALGILLLMLVRAGLLAEPWRRGLLPFLMMWLAYPLVMAVATLSSADAADQLGDSRNLALFASHNLFLGIAAGMGTLLGHLVHAVRHEAYEAGVLGRYTLKRRLGVGGMGEVWIAHHRTLRQDVALKVLKPELGSSQEAVARFEREVRATTRLSHPNTIRVMDHGVTDDGLWYYAMELLAGCDLGELIRDEGAQSPERVVRLMRQACGSLAEAHGMGFVHRDIKPANLFVASMGGIQDVVKVLDFGIAKVSRDLEDTRLTRENAVAGTPMYVAPETIRGEEVDARSDVYSLGCVMYTMLAGREPFEAAQTITLLLQHVELDPEPPSVKRGGPLPADLEAVVMRCLAKAPADRYSDADALDSALAACATAERA